MRNITYKYNVGDYVKFKDKFSSPTTGLVGREGTVAKITGIAPSYNNKPYYYLNGSTEEVFAESVFAGRYEDPKEAKWYRISFSAKLNADDLRAMKKCFFDAMNESMEIYDLDGLEIKEA